MNVKNPFLDNYYFYLLLGYIEGNHRKNTDRSKR